MMSFEQIDAIRESHGLTRIAVYSLAGVDGETWRRSAKGQTQPGSATLKKLEKALTDLIAADTADGETGID